MEVPSALEGEVRPVLGGLGGFSTYAKGVITDDEIASPTPDTDE